MKTISKLLLFLAIFHGFSISAMVDNENLNSAESESKTELEEKRSAEDKETIETQYTQETTQDLQIQEETKEREDKAQNEIPERILHSYHSFNDIANDLEQGANPFNGENDEIESSNFYTKRTLKKILKKHLAKKHEILKQTTKLPDEIVQLVQNYYYSSSSFGITTEFDEYIDLIQSKKLLKGTALEAIEESIHEIEEKILSLLKQNEIGSQALSTMLEKAAKAGLLNWIEILIKNGALNNKRAHHALYYAADSGHLDIVKILLDNKENTDINVTEILLELLNYLFLNNNHILIIQELIKSGADIKNNNAIIRACRLGNKEIIELFIKEGANVNRIIESELLGATTPLIIVITKYLDNKKSFNEARETVADLTKYEEKTNLYLNILELLIQAGADAYMEIFNHELDRNQTIFDYAKGDANLLRILRKSKMSYPNPMLNINHALGTALQEQIDECTQRFNSSFIGSKLNTIKEIEKVIRIETIRTLLGMKREFVNHPFETSLVLSAMVFTVGCGGYAAKIIGIKLGEDIRDISKKFARIFKH